MMERRENQTPQGQTARVLVEFLEVAITAVVFLKGVYPSGAFERRRYMNVVVQRARHPQLRYYIHATVSGLLPFLQKVTLTPNSTLWNLCCLLAIYIDGSSADRKYAYLYNKQLKGMVERVAVIFFNSDNVPLEKFVFKLAMNQSYGSTVEETDLEFSLRSFLIKLSISESLTKDLPPDCRWEITAYFQSLPETGTSKEADLWIPTDTKQWQQPPLITPIKSMSREPLCLQLYLEHPCLSESML